MKKRLTETVFSTDYEKEVQFEFRKIMDEFSKMQDQYDKETNHSLNGSAQRKWERYIQKELVHYNKFRYLPRSN